VIVGRTPAGERLLAHVPPGDAATLGWLTGGADEPVGQAGSVRRESDGLLHWRQV